MHTLLNVHGDPEDDHATARAEENEHEHENAPDDVHITLDASPASWSSAIAFDEQDDFHIDEDERDQWDADGRGRDVHRRPRIDEWIEAIVLLGDVDRPKPDGYGEKTDPEPVENNELTVERVVGQPAL